MTGISPALAFEVAETWETMAEMEAKSSPDRRATLRECADMVRMLATRATPPATPIAGGFGSRPQEAVVPTEPVADRWADLERLAREWGAISPDNPSTTCKERGAFRDAANPAAILELIDAARRDEEAGQ